MVDYKQLVVDLELLQVYNLQHWVDNTDHQLNSTHMDNKLGLN
jgi:hypothetical protein